MGLRNNSRSNANIRLVRGKTPNKAENIETDALPAIRGAINKQNNPFIFRSEFKDKKDEVVLRGAEKVWNSINGRLAWVKIDDGDAALVRVYNSGELDYDINKIADPQTPLLLLDDVDARIRGGHIVGAIGSIKLFARDAKIDLLQSNGGEKLLEATLRKCEIDTIGRASAGSPPFIDRMDDCIVEKITDSSDIESGSRNHIGNIMGVNHILKLDYSTISDIDGSAEGFFQLGPGCNLENVQEAHNGKARYQRTLDLNPGTGPGEDIRIHNLYGAKVQIKTEGIIRIDMLRRTPIEYYDDLDIEKLTGTLQINNIEGTAGLRGANIIPPKNATNEHPVVVVKRWDIQRDNLTGYGPNDLSEQVIGRGVNIETLQIFDGSPSLPDFTDYHLLLNGQIDELKVYESLQKTKIELMDNGYIKHILGGREANHPDLTTPVELVADGKQIGKIDDQENRINWSNVTNGERLKRRLKREKI